MDAIEKAKELIRQFEGLRLKAYRCPAGKLTIGYGSTSGVTENMIIGLEKAERILTTEVEEVYKSLKSCVKVPMNNNQWAALLSFTHNIGITRVRASTLMKKLNAGDREGAGEEFLKWKYAKGVLIEGLTNRRQEEKAFFQGGISI